LLLCELRGGLAKGSSDAAGDNQGRGGNETQQHGPQAQDVLWQILLKLGGRERSVACQDETRPPRPCRTASWPCRAMVVKANQARVEDKLCDVVLCILFVSVAVAAATTNTPHPSLSQN